LPEYKNQPTNFANGQHTIEQWPDIELAEANPATANLLIEHESNIAFLLQRRIQFIKRPSLIMSWDTVWWFALMFK
jgi:hypothetical protein